MLPFCETTLRLQRTVLSSNRTVNTLYIPSYHINRETTSAFILTRQLKYIHSYDCCYLLSEASNEEHVVLSHLTSWRHVNFPFVVPLYGSFFYIQYCTNKPSRLMSSKIRRTNLGLISFKKTEILSKHLNYNVFFVLSLLEKYKDWNLYVVIFVRVTVLFIYWQIRK